MNELSGQISWVEEPEIDKSGYTGWLILFRLLQVAGLVAIVASIGLIIHRQEFESWTGGIAIVAAIITGGLEAQVGYNRREGRYAHRYTVDASGITIVYNNNTKQFLWEDIQGWIESEEIAHLLRNPRLIYTTVSDDSPQQAQDLGFEYVDQEGEGYFMMYPSKTGNEGFQLNPPEQQYEECSKLLDKYATHLAVQDCKEIMRKAYNNKK